MGILDDAIKEHLELKRAHGAPEEELRQKEAEAFGPIRQGTAAPAEAPDAAYEEPDPETVLYEDAATEYEPAPETIVEAEPLVEPQPAPRAAPERPPVADDPYEVHPGDQPVPDPHHEGEPLGSDPPYREDAAVFAESAPQAPPAPPHHEEEPHPALHEHDDLRGEVHPPEPAFRPEREAEAPPADVEAPPADKEPPTEPQPAATEPQPAPAEPLPEDEPPPEADVDLGEEDVLEETPEFLQDAPEHDRLWFEQRPPRDFDFGE